MGAVFVIYTDVEPRQPPDCGMSGVIEESLKEVKFGVGDDVVTGD